MNKTYTIQLQDIDGNEIAMVNVVGELDGYNTLPFCEGELYIIDKYHDGRVDICRFDGWDKNEKAQWTTVYEDVFIGYTEGDEYGD